MSSKINVPNSLKVNKVSGIKNFVGQRVTKKVKFMGKDLEIKKLTVSEVMEIQEKAKAIEQDEQEGFNVLKTVIRMAADGGEDLEDGDFDSFPLEELSRLSNQIMSFSGIGEQQGK